jgi:hypothetical protein
MDQPRKGVLLNPRELDAARVPRDAVLQLSEHRAAGSSVIR